MIRYTLLHFLGIYIGVAIAFICYSLYTVIKFEKRYNEGKTKFYKFKITLAEIGFSLIVGILWPIILIISMRMK